MFVEEGDDGFLDVFGGGIDGAGFGAEAVEEPGKFAEGRDLEDLEAAGFVCMPIRIGLAGGIRQECLSYFGDLAFGL